MYTALYSIQYLYQYRYSKNMHFPVIIKLNLTDKVQYIKERKIINDAVGSSIYDMIIIH